MRHSKNTKNLGRFSAWRLATMRSMVKAVLKNGRIKTSRRRAKLARSTLEHLITIAKDGSLASRRYAFKFLGEHSLVNRLFGDIAPLFSKRQSGFSRIIHLGRRRGDNAEMVFLELTESLKEQKPKKAKEKPAKEEIAQPKAETPKEAPISKKPAGAVVKEKPVKEQKPKTKFLGGLRTLFKKERDSL